jgi:hypothetical protein
MELYKFDKSMVENKITRGQFKDIYKNDVFNINTFHRIVSSPRFSIRYDNNKILLATIMVIQNEYRDNTIEIVNSILDKKASPKLIKRVVSQAKAYGAFCYYKDLNNDKIPLPSNVLNYVKSTFINFSPVVKLDELDSANYDANSFKIIKFLLQNKNFTYLIYDITETGYISSYIYQRLELDFKVDKIELKINKLLISEDEY